MAAMLQHDQRELGEERLHFSFHLLTIVHPKGSQHRDTAGSRRQEAGGRKLEAGTKAEVTLMHSKRCNAYSLLSLLFDSTQDHLPKVSSPTEN